MPSACVFVHSCACACVFSCACVCARACTLPINDRFNSIKKNTTDTTRQVLYLTRSPISKIGHPCQIRAPKRRKTGVTFHRYNTASYNIPNRPEPGNERSLKRRKQPQIKLHELQRHTFSADDTFSGLDEMLRFSAAFLCNLLVRSHPGNTAIMCMETLWGMAPCLCK